MKTRLAAAAFALGLISSGSFRSEGDVEIYIRTTANSSVGFIHGVYHMALPDGTSTRPSEYTGSAFMVRDGWIASCRHVLAPWNDDARHRDMFASGAVPVFTVLTITFPGRSAMDIDPMTIRHSTLVDTAVARLSTPSDIPILEMREDGTEGTGVNAYVLGYPLGVGPLYYRSPAPGRMGYPNFGSLGEKLAYLSRLGLVEPLFFRGVINSSKRHLITTDAAMTFGCSGGPVLGDDGRVIGVNFAILSGFDGMNMVVPICHILHLIRG